MKQVNHPLTDFHRSPSRQIDWRGLLLACLLLTFLPSQTWAEPDSYLLSVLPFFPANELEKTFSPAVKHLSQSAQQPIRLSTRRTTRLFGKELINETDDIAFVQPFDYVNIASKHSYLPLARIVRQSTAPQNPEGTITAIIVSLDHKDSQQGLQFLRNKILATPPEDVAVSLLTRLMILNAGLKPGKDITLHPTHNHKSCLQQLFLRQADAYVSVKPIIQNFKRLRKVGLYVIAESSPIPSPLYIVHQCIPQAMRENLRLPILNWRTDNPETSQILKAIRVQNFIPTIDTDYGSVRRIWTTLKK